MGREGKGRKGTRSDGKGRAKVQPPPPVEISQVQPWSR